MNKEAQTETLVQTPANPDVETLKRIQELGKGNYSKFGPHFKRYLEKALQSAHGKVSPPQVQQEVPDGGALFKYQQMVGDIKDLASIANLSNGLLKNLYKVQAKIKETYQKVAICEEQLRPYIRGNMLFINDDSKDLLEKLESFKDELRSEVKEMQRAVEDGFDEIGGFQI